MMTELTKNVATLARAKRDAGQLLHAARSVACTERCLACMSAATLFRMPSVRTREAASFVVKN